MCVFLCFLFFYFINVCVCLGCRQLLPPADYLRFCELTKWLQQDFSVDNPAHEV